VIYSAAVAFFPRRGSAMAGLLGKFPFTWACLLAGAGGAAVLGWSVLGILLGAIVGAFVGAVIDESTKKRR
jgi:hypothetical protein